MAKEIFWLSASFRICKHVSLQILKNTAFGSNRQRALDGISGSLLISILVRLVLTPQRPRSFFLRRKYFQNFLQFGQADLIDSSTRLSDLNLGSSAAASSRNKSVSIFSYLNSYNTLQIKKRGLLYLHDCLMATQVRPLLTRALHFLIR